MRRAVLVVMLACSNCVRARPTAPPPVALPVEMMSGPDGKPAAFIRCGARAQDCFRIAGLLCPNGYATHDRDKSLGPTHVARGGTTTMVDKTAVHSGNTTAYTEQDNTLFVSCPGIDDRRREIEARDRAEWEASERRSAMPPRCGYTCAPQPRECPFLDKDGCYKPEYEVPPQ